MTARDERGAVAVVVALAVTFVLVPVAALSLDLGSLYVREAALQQLADDAASAGAAELARLQRDDGDAAPVPSAVMAAARAVTVKALCAAATGGDGTPWAAACSGPTTWAGDGDPSNGEVSFYTGTPAAGLHSFLPTQDAAGALTGTLISGIRVVTPPSRVTFGLAGVFGRGHADTRRSATAGLFSVLPAAGFLPMFLRPGEYGAFCTRSAPASVWQDTVTLIYGGVCYTNPVPRGYLTAPRTNSSQNTSTAVATTWNTATGFDPDHLPLRGGSATVRGYSSWSPAYIRDLKPGLIDGTSGLRARLKRGTCAGGYDATSVGQASGLESAYLGNFADSRTGDKSGLRSLVLSGTKPTPDQYGWLAPSILRCGRLAVVPVLGNLPTTWPTSTSATSYPVTGLRLVWIDDRMWATDTPVTTSSCIGRGLYWLPGSWWGCSDTFAAYTGYVLDPRLLPATVAGTDAANALSEFVGSGLPVTVRLLRDVADQPAG